MLFTWKTFRAQSRKKLSRIGVLCGLADPGLCCLSRIRAPSPKQRPRLPFFRLQEGGAGNLWGACLSWRTWPVLKSGHTRPFVCCFPKLGRVLHTGKWRAAGNMAAGGSYEPRQWTTAAFGGWQGGKESGGAGQLRGNCWALDWNFAFAMKKELAESVSKIIDSILKRLSHFSST